MQLESKAVTVRRHFEMKGEERLPFYIYCLNATLLSECAGSAAGHPRPLASTFGGERCRSDVESDRVTALR